MRYAAFTGWRGICALLIALHHLGAASHIYDLSIIRHAPPAVDFFFVLSGFTLAYVYSGRINSAGDIGTLLWRRLGRIWPLHAIVLVAFVGLEVLASVVAAKTGVPRRMAMFDPDSAGQLAAIPTHLLMLHSLGLHDQLTWNVPSWSISAEFWIYLVFALVILFVRRWATVAGIGLSLLGLAVVVANVEEMGDAHFSFGFFRCLCDFFLGLAVYRITKRFPTRLAMASVVEVIAVCATYVYVAYFSTGLLSFAAPLVCGILVWIFSHEAGVVSRLLESRPFAAIGNWSFSIYIIHSLLIMLINRGAAFAQQRLGTPMLMELQTSHGPHQLLDFGGPLAMDAATIVYVAVLLALAAFTTRYVEKPLQKKWNGLLKPRAVVVPQAMVA